MKYITPSAEENQKFREWLSSLDGSPLWSQGYRDVMTRLAGRVKVGGRTFGREEMNGR